MIHTLFRGTRHFMVEVEKKILENEKEEDEEIRPVERMAADEATKALSKPT